MKPISLSIVLALLLCSGAMAKEINFDAKTAANLKQIHDQIVQLQQTANVIIQTVANVNGVDDYEIKKDLTGMIIKEAAKDEITDQVKANPAAQ